MPSLPSSRTARWAFGVTLLVLVAVGGPLLAGALTTAPAGVRTSGEAASRSASCVAAGDCNPPVVRIAHLAVDPVGHLTAASGRAWDRGGGVRTVQIRLGRSGAWRSATGTVSWHWTASADASPSAVFVRAIDAAGNVSTTSGSVGVEGPCLSTATSVSTIGGDQTEGYRRMDLPRSTGIDATSARWVDAGPWPVHVEADAGLCWHGGEIDGTYPDQTSWEELHSTGAFNLFAPAATIEDLRVHDYGDGIRVLDGATDFTILDVHLSFIRDDCIENDDVHGGVVRRALLDGCYVAFSARPWSESFTGDGHDRVWEISDSAIRLQPMPTVYRGPAPGHGGFFKWDTEGRGPMLSLHHNVFRADQDSNHTTMGIPPGSLRDCSDNVMVWLGEGPYPAPLPDCFRITRDPAVWDAAVAHWTAQHPSG